LIENKVNPILHKSKTLESREKVPSMVLPSTFWGRDKLPKIINMNSPFQYNLFWQAN